jgi:hypothetical protein
VNLLTPACGRRKEIRVIVERRSHETHIAGIKAVARGTPRKRHSTGNTITIFAFGYLWKDKKEVSGG